MTTDAVRARQQRIWALSWPLLLANLTAPLLGLVDTAVVGHLPDPRYLAAVALGSSVFMFLYFAFNFLRMGTTGFASQARGAGEDTRVLLGRALLLAAVLGLALILSQPLWRPLSLWLLGGSEAVQQLAGEYMQLRILGAPAALANFALIGYAIGLQRTRVALKMTVLMHSSNALLDVLLVQVWSFDVRGVAMASASAEYIGLLGGLYWLRDTLRRPGGKRIRFWNGPAMLALLAVNRDLFVRSLALLSVFFFFTAQGARQGDQVVAANAVLITFLLLLSNLLDAFANAAEALVGEARGQNNNAQFRQAIADTGRWTVAISLLAMLAFALGGQPLIHLLTDLDSIRTTATSYLPWMLLLPLTASAGFWLDGIFVGATWSRAMRNTMLLAVALFFLLWWLSQPLGNHGLWLALNGFMLGRGLLMGGILQKKL